MTTKYEIEYVDGVRTTVHVRWSFGKHIPIVEEGVSTRAPFTIIYMDGSYVPIGCLNDWIRHQRVAKPHEQDRRVSWPSWRTFGIVIVVFWGMIWPGYGRHCRNWCTCSLYRQWIWICIWATAFIYFDEKKMWRQAGFEEMLVSPAKRDPNEMGGTTKTRYCRFWCASYLWTYWCHSLENETNHGGKVPKPEKRD